MFSGFRQKGTLIKFRIWSHVNWCPQWWQSWMSDWHQNTDQKRHIYNMDHSWFNFCLQNFPHGGPIKVGSVVVAILELIDWLSCCLMSSEHYFWDVPDEKMFTNNINDTCTIWCFEGYIYIFLLSNAWNGKQKKCCFTADYQLWLLTNCWSLEVVVSLLS